MPQRILVVDDDKQIARLIRSYLEQAGYQVLVAYDGETALHALRRESPDLVVLDLMLPDRDGWDITRTVRSDPALAATPIIMVTARVEDTDKIVGLELGADDYVTKPFSVAEVVARVNAAVRRSKRFETSEADYTFDDFTLDVKGQVLRKGGEQLELSQKEFLMLKLFLENEGKVLSRQEILAKVWGFDYYGTDRTVDNFINKLRQKIEPDINAPSHILTMRGSGYKFLR